MTLDVHDHAAELAAVGTKLSRKGKTKDALLKLLKVRKRAVEFDEASSPMHVSKV